MFLSNIYGGTCLMNSVLCTNLIKFLISKGANVNAIGFDSPSLCCQGWV